MAGPLMILLLTGGLGPSTAGIIMTHRAQDREGRIASARRFVTW
jgi:hypothetical protein